MGIKPIHFTLCLLAELLKTSKSITYLNLSGNAIFSVEFAQCIFKSLQHNTTLLTLNLSRTAIDGMNYDKSRSSVASSFIDCLKETKVSLTSNFLVIATHAVMFQKFSKHYGTIPH